MLRQHQQDEPLVGNAEKRSKREAFVSANMTTSDSTKAIQEVFPFDRVRSIIMHLAFSKIMEEETKLVVTAFLSANL